MKQRGRGRVHDRAMRQSSGGRAGPCFWRAGFVDKSPGLGGKSRKRLANSSW